MFAYRACLTRRCKRRPMGFGADFISVFSTLLNQSAVCAPNATNGAKPASDQMQSQPPDRAAIDPQLLLIFAVISFVLFVAVVGFLLCVAVGFTCLLMCRATCTASIPRRPPRRPPTAPAATCTRSAPTKTLTSATRRRSGRCRSHIRGQLSFSVSTYQTSQLCSPLFAALHIHIRLLNAFSCALLHTAFASLRFHFHDARISHVSNTRSYSTRFPLPPRVCALPHFLSPLCAPLLKCPHRFIASSFVEAFTCTTF